MIRTISDDLCVIHRFRDRMELEFQEEARIQTPVRALRSVNNRSFSLDITMTTIRGLHSCKVGNTPYVGDVKTFITEERTGKSGKAWTKIRSASQQDGGRPYEVMSVEKTDYTDAHGNISFNVEIVPVTIPEDRSKGAVPVQTASQTRSEGPTARPNGGGYEERSQRIERQHSQSAAIAYATLKGLKDITPQDMVALIDWFARDVGRKPAPPKKAKPAEPESPEPDIDNAEEEF